MSNKSIENQEKNISAAPSSSLLLPMDPPTKQLSSYDSGSLKQRTRSFCGEPTTRPLLHSSSAIGISDPEREMKKLTVLLKEKDKQMKALERTLSLKEMKLEECLRNEQKLRHNENEFHKLISSQSTTERRQDVVILQDMTSQLEEREEIIHRLHLTNDTLATSLDQLQRTSSSTIKTLQEELQATRDEIVSLHSMLKRSTETKMTLDEEKVTTLTEEVSDSCCHRITILSDDLSTLRGSLESTELKLKQP
jgi:seryl-tRNA synthetase